MWYRAELNKIAMLEPTNVSVLVFDYVCYAQIADHKQLRFFYNNANYSSMIDAMSHIKKCENEFVPHKMVGKSSMHKGKIQLDGAAVREKEKKHLVETFYGNKRW